MTTRQYDESLATYESLRETIARLTDERDALAAAMPSEGADAALAYAVEKSSRERLERQIAAVQAACEYYDVRDNSTNHRLIALIAKVRALLTDAAKEMR